MPTRREFLAGALALWATACTGGTKPKPSSSPSGTPTSIADLTSGVPQLSLLGLGPGATGEGPTNPIQTGTNLLSFDLSVGTQGQLVEEGTPLLYAATSETAALKGPFSAAWSLFTGYDKT